MTKEVEIRELDAAEIEMISGGVRVIWVKGPNGPVPIAIDWE